MNKRILLAGVSAVALSFAVAAPSKAQIVEPVPEPEPIYGAWAEVNGPSGGTVENNGTELAPTLDPGQVRPNEITDSFNGTQGIAHVQQNEGSANSINAAGAVQVSINQTTPAMSGAFVNSRVEENYAVQLDGTRTNDITNSFVDSQGVFTVQQNNGDQNEIGSAEAIQANQNSLGDASTTAEVRTAAFNNATDQRGGVRSNDITDSFRNGSSGVFTVQQNNGDHNAMGSATAVYGATGGQGDVEQGVSVQGSASSNEGLDGPMTSVNTVAPNVRTNTIDPSFDSASGIVTVQQNNGNANAIGAGTGVAGNIGGQNLPGPGSDDNVFQSVEAEGEVVMDGEGPAVVDVVTDIFSAHSRDNSIEGGSFDGYQGIATVQQNNGDQNAISAATAVNYNKDLAQTQVQNDVPGQFVAVGGNIRNARAVDDDTTNLFGLTVQGGRSNQVDSSFNNGAAGISSVQQNNGNLNLIGVGTGVHVNLGNTASSLNGDDTVGLQVVVAGGSAEDGDAIHLGGPVTTDTIEPVHRDNRLTNAFDGYQGIANVQQNNGDANVMSAAVGVVASIDSSDKFDDIDEESMALSDSNSVVGNESTEIPGEFFSGANRRNVINPSFNGAKGIATVQQNNGNNNVIASATAVVANVGPVGDGGDLAAGGVRNAAIGGGATVDNLAIGHPFADRKNSISESFQGAQGIMTVQQNNGDNNAIGATTAVAADVDTGGTGFGPAVSTASLEAQVSGNETVTFAPAEQPGLINTVNSGAFNGAVGVMTVQQNNGGNNVMQSAIAMSANLTTPR